MQIWMDGVQSMNIYDKMLEINRGVSFLPLYAVNRSIEQGRLSILHVTDYRASLYRQIFSHKEKWHTREMNEFIEMAGEES